MLLRAKAERPPFLSLIAQNRLFLAFTALVVSLPLFMPLAVSVVSGESVAGEASIGTLRYVLTVPVSRLRLLLVKYAAIAVYALVAALVVAGVGILVGSLLFPIGPVPLLSGDVLPYSAALVRALLVALYVGAMLAGVAAIGLFISTLTEVPLGAMAATAACASWRKSWMRFLSCRGCTTGCSATGGSRSVICCTPVVYDDVGRGLLTQAAYIVVFSSPGPASPPATSRPEAVGPGARRRWQQKRARPEAGPSRYASADVIRPDGRSRPAGLQALRDVELHALVLVE